jgi:hypothetical protein
MLYVSSDYFTRLVRLLPLGRAPPSGPSTPQCLLPDSLDIDGSFIYQYNIVYHNSTIQGPLETNTAECWKVLHWRSPNLSDLIYLLRRR